ncbi:hypothetical protein [Amycolatopsis minnesotensis]|uniref:hypothetical protein n=1 Tax=Amycolatopsis minnesotensis TaxID=337894 RepID=UPI0031D24CEE
MSENSSREPGTRVERVPSGSRADRAIGAVGWWLPETVAAAAVAGFAAWLGWSFLIPVIGVALVARIAWEWAPTRRSARVVTALVTAIACRIRRRRRTGETASAAPAGDPSRADEVAS